MVLSSVTHRILLIEDDEKLGRQILDQLREAGFEPSWIRQGDEALAVRARDHDLVILDLMLPGAFGLDVLKRLRSQSDLPVVVLSGLPPADIGDGLDRLPVPELPPLLQKPIDSRQLFQVIELKLAGELP